jgi:hypothetical protein
MQMPATAARHASQPDAATQPKEEAARPEIHVAEGASAAAPSPARALQARLEQDLRGDAQEEIVEGRWPLYVALPFWGGVSALMWAAIIGCTWLVLRHI